MSINNDHTEHAANFLYFLDAATEESTSAKSEKSVTEVEDPPISLNSPKDQQQKDEVKEKAEAINNFFNYLKQEISNNKPNIPPQTIPTKDNHKETILDSNPKKKRNIRKIKN